MKLLHILKSKKGMAAELVAISLMFVFTVLSISALLTADSVLRGVQSDYSEEQAKIYAITLSQAIENQLIMYNNCYADSYDNPMPDVYTQYLNDLGSGAVSDGKNLSSFLYDKYLKQHDTSDINFQYVSNTSIPNWVFDINIKIDTKNGWNDLKIDITTKATYNKSKDDKSTNKSTYSIVKGYTIKAAEEGEVFDGNDKPCNWVPYEEVY